MQEGVRFEAALAASHDILERLGLPPGDSPHRLSKVAYAVLEAIYESERRLAEQQGHWVRLPGNVSRN
jgi:hypothetical protein